ncbi:hypothetical protein LCGC14_1238650 [marine sediment metagenome]|uniref:Uncharacterized protein n=1 Tax=marine sediment metagenome TaxID=412755 RepID=A0A0F9NNP1_9ZZZZ|nr:hypothetical protein [Pricia sp.]
MKILFSIDFNGDKDILQRMFKDWWKEIKNSDSLKNIRWGKTANDNEVEFTILGYQEYQDLLVKEAESKLLLPEEEIEDTL